MKIKHWQSSDDLCPNLMRGWTYVQDKLYPISQAILDLLPF